MRGPRDVHTLLWHGDRVKVAATTSNVALAQSSGLTFANDDSDFAEHRKNPQRRVRPPLRLQDMRDAKRQSRRRRPARGATEVNVVWADAGTVSDDEARELLEHGLRILARLAVRAYLRREASLPTAEPEGQCTDKPG